MEIMCLIFNLHAASKYFRTYKSIHPFNFLRLCCSGLQRKLKATMYRLHRATSVIYTLFLRLYAILYINNIHKN